MCSCDWDPAEFYRTIFRVARKAHNCYECGREICPGERYRYTSAKWDGNVSDAKTCIGCSAGIEWLADECGCWQHGNVAQELIDHFYDGHSSWNLGRLIASMGQQWTRADGSLLPVPA